MPDRAAQRRRKPISLRDRQERTDLRIIQPGDADQLRQVLAKETKIELERKRNGFVKEDDLISPSKKLSALATLYSSLVRRLPELSESWCSFRLWQDWFIHRVSSLKSAEGTPAAFSNGFSGPLGARRPRESAYSIASTDTGHSLGSHEGEDEAADDRPEGFALPLTSEMTKCVSDDSLVERSS